MIITCYNCSTKFAINPAALGPAGHTVRCSRCGNRWHQFPEDADGNVKPIFTDPIFHDDTAPSSVRDGDDVDPFAPTGATEDDVDRAFADILGEEDGTAPEGALPVRATPVIERASKAEPSSPTAALQSVAIPAIAKNARRAELRRLPYLIFMLATLLTAVGLVVFRPQIVQLWPASSKLYGVVHMPVDVYGEQFKISNLDARIELLEDKRVLIVSGDLANNSDNTEDYPHFLIRAYKGIAPGIAQEWILKVGDNELKPNDIIPFKLGLESFPEDVTTIKVTIAPSPSTSVPQTGVDNHENAESVQADVPQQDQNEQQDEQQDEHSGH